MKTLALALLAALALAPAVRAQAQTDSGGASTATAPGASAAQTTKKPAEKARTSEKKPVHEEKKKPVHETSKKPVHEVKKKSEREVRRRRAHEARRKPVHEAKKAQAQIPVENPTLKLTEEQLAIAPKVYTGLMQCEQGVDVNVLSDDRHPGFFQVVTGKHYYYMHPVVSRTGAVRLQDDRAGAVWLQLGNKSILLDHNQGGSVVDGCVGTVQREYVAHMADHPAPDLLGLDKK